MAAKCPNCQLPLADHPEASCPRCGETPGARPRPHRVTVRQSAVATVANRTAVGPALVPHPPTENTETPHPPDHTHHARVGPPAAGSVPDGVDDGPDAPPAHVPGYRIERVIGHGGMGSVHLATQLSLDRPVALKIMSKYWAADPVFVARFTREAFAAALLNHPNVVQIYDIGDVDGTKFFSMEYVPGRTLADVVRDEGKLDPETAVGYVLQAARGLKHAHDRGMIHRDVKPDNLLLDDQGIVKVADLGLVKTPDLRPEADRLADAPSAGLQSLPPDMTGARMALGTPAYMAPEQCRDASNVDHRADIYALGATLYALVAGRPPFDGVTAVELMTKQAYAPLVPPEAHVGRVPKDLSAVIVKMMAKSPAERFADMDEVVRTLEGWLGVHRAGTFAPRDEQIEQVEKYVRAFNTAPAAVLRARVLAAAAPAGVLAAILLLFFGRVGWAFGLAAMIVQGAVAYFVLNGLAHKSHLFSRVRQFLFGCSAGDWMVAAAAVGLFGVLLSLLGLFGTWVGFGAAGVGLALVMRYALDRQVDRERRAPVHDCERLLRLLRPTGVDEAELRQFVAKYAGRHWEEFFEVLFGYEAKLAARVMLSRGGWAGVREKFAGWREPLVALLDRVEQARQEGRERKLLEQVEKARLLAAGLVEQAAGERAAAAAAALVGQAKAGRYVDPGRRTIGPGAQTPVGLPRAASLLTHAAPARPDRPPMHPVERVASAVVGPRVRTVLAAVLLAGCTLWVYQNRLFAAAPDPTLPLMLDGVPAEWTGW
ncbi:MAG TPA: serine/threonine-protein kinase, partial [Fimbriiglobus sp.]|nr:serine/threonine-protein kinase [Fimbriiglobus sp.]